MMHVNGSLPHAFIHKKLAVLVERKDVADDT
jgi:hypothetical protein